MQRVITYLAVLYEGGGHGVTGVSELNLILTDDRSLVSNSNTSDNLSVAYMGLRSTLIQWHKDAVYANQGNRNPFVDHPEYVACVFESNCTGLGGPGSSSGSSELWINELHYDNQGSDKRELVELAGLDNSGLSGWKIIVYKMVQQVFVH